MRAIESAPSKRIQASMASTSAWVPEWVPRLPSRPFHVTMTSREPIVRPRTASLAVAGRCVNSGSGLPTEMATLDLTDELGCKVLGRYRGRRTQVEVAGLVASLVDLEDSDLALGRVRSDEALAEHRQQDIQDSRTRSQPNTSHCDHHAITGSVGGFGHPRRTARSWVAIPTHRRIVPDPSRHDRTVSGTSGRA